jgi:DNA-binding FrmR family transcriptional regulator
MGYSVERAQTTGSQTTLLNIPYQGIVLTRSCMGHVSKNRDKLLNRVKRLRGQIEAIQRSVEADEECARVLQQATACRGALDGFIAEMIEGHIREHVIDPKRGPDTPEALAADDLIDIVHQYLRR